MGSGHTEGAPGTWYRGRRYSTLGSPSSWYDDAGQLVPYDSKLYRELERQYARKMMAHAGMKPAGPKPKPLGKTRGDRWLPVYKAARETLGEDEAIDRVCRAEWSDFGLDEEDDTKDEKRRANVRRALGRARDRQRRLGGH